MLQIYCIGSNRLTSLTISNGIVLLCELISMSIGMGFQSNPVIVLSLDIFNLAFIYSDSVPISWSHVYHHFICMWTIADGVDILNEIFMLLVGIGRQTYMVYTCTSAEDKQSRCYGLNGSMGQSCLSWTLCMFFINIKICITRYILIFIPGE